MNIYTDRLLWVNWLQLISPDMSPEQWLWVRIAQNHWAGECRANYTNHMCVWVCPCLQLIVCVYRKASTDITTTSVAQLEFQQRTNPQLGVHDCGESPLSIGRERSQGTTVPLGDHSFTALCTPAYSCVWGDQGCVRINLIRD